MSVVGSVVVIRVGGDVTFAEKVWMAERNGAGGVLIYPDPADLPQDPRRLGLNTHTAVSEHVTHTQTHTSTSLLLLANQYLCFDKHRSIWAQVTPLPLAFLRSITPSSRPSSPPVSHSFLSCQ